MDFSGLGWMSDAQRVWYDDLRRKPRERWTDRDRTFWSDVRGRQRAILNQQATQCERDTESIREDQYLGTFPGGDEGEEMDNPRL
jgi:hypothetical protein